MPAQPSGKLTITANDNSITYGDVPAANGMTGTGFVSSESIEDLSGELAYSYNYEQFGNVGAYKITPSGVTSNDYEITFADGSLIVNAKAITEADVELNGSLTYTGEEQTQPITVTEGITYEVSGNKATNVGTYELTVKGTDNYTGEVKLSWSLRQLLLLLVLLLLQRR